MRYRRVDQICGLPDVVMVELICYNTSDEGCAEMSGQGRGLERAQASSEEKKVVLIDFEPLEKGFSRDEA
jgi:hypothetical protein